MAPSRDIELGPWPDGINNLVKEDKVPSKAVREAENLDFDDDGTPVRRPGAEEIDDTATHSLWAHPQYPYLLGAQGATIQSWDRNLEKVELVDGLTLRQAISFDLIAGGVFWSNTFESGWIAPDTINRPWSAEQPIGQPLVAAGAAGGLEEGKYLVAVTFIDELGRESGSTLATEIDLTTGQGIALSSIPVPQRGDTAWVRVYASAPNGSELRMVRDLVPGTTSWNVGAHEAGRALETQFLEPLPAGQIVRRHNGRQLVARGRVLFWSEAMRYGLSNLASSYLRFDGDITLVESAANDVLFVAAGDRTYLLRGEDPKKWQKAIAYSSGAVIGSAAQVDGNAFAADPPLTGVVPVWMAKDGQLVLGLPNGTVQQQTDRYVALVDVEAGATALRSYNGVRHLVSILKGGTRSGFAASDTAVAEVYRNGVLVG